MTLDEAFEKYTDDIRLKRPNQIFNFPIKRLKGLKSWGNEE